MVINIEYYSLIYIKYHCVLAPSRALSTAMLLDAMARNHRKMVRGGDGREVV